MPAKGFKQSVGRVVRDLAATLASSDCSSELDLRQRQDRKSVPRVAGGEAKKPIRPRLVHVQFDEGARF
jgi:hypothetical protein